MSKSTKQCWSCLLVVVFFFYITPKEIWHAFTHHIDTIHELHSNEEKGYLQISGEHHHCELLKFDQQFHAIEFEIPYFELPKSPNYLSQSFSLAFESKVSGRNEFIQPLRGPPLC